MPGDTATAGNLRTSDADKVVNLKGMPGNPGRDPKRASKEGRGSLGDRALMKAVFIVGVAWALLLLLAFSLRNHNV